MSTFDVRSAELQQQWHGWGSPVGMGIVLLGFGLCVFFLGLGWQAFTS